MAPGDWTDRHAPPALDVLRRWVADATLGRDRGGPAPGSWRPDRVRVRRRAEVRPSSPSAAGHDVGPDECAEDPSGDVVLKAGDWVLREPGGVAAGRDERRGRARRGACSKEISGLQGRFRAPDRQRRGRASTSWNPAFHPSRRGPRQQRGSPRGSGVNSRRIASRSACVRLPLVLAAPGSPHAARSRRCARARQERPRPGRRFTGRLPTVRPSPHSANDAPLADAGPTISIASSSTTRQRNTLAACERRRHARSAPPALRRFLPNAAWSASTSTATSPWTPTTLRSGSTSASDAAQAARAGRQHDRAPLVDRVERAPPRARNTNGARAARCGGRAATPGRARAPRPRPRGRASAATRRATARPSTRTVATGRARWAAAAPPRPRHSTRPGRQAAVRAPPLFGLDVTQPPASVAHGACRAGPSTSTPAARGPSLEEAARPPRPRVPPARRAGPRLEERLEVVPGAIVLELEAVELGHAARPQRFR